MLKDYNLDEVQKFSMRIVEGMLHSLLKAVGTQPEKSVHRANVIGLLNALITEADSCGNDFFLADLVDDAKHLLCLFSCVDGCTSLIELKDAVATVCPGSQKSMLLVAPHSLGFFVQPLAGLKP